MNGGAKCWDCALVGLMLRLRWALVAESCKGLVDVTGHAEMDISSLVVPVKGQAEVAGALPISVASVVL